MKSLLSWRGHAWLCLPARLYLGGVFLFACVHKLLHPGVFALDIATYDILPLAWINLMAITLPWVELTAGVMLILGWRTRGAALSTAGMMLMFIVAVLLALEKGLDMSCGCFASQAAAEGDSISYFTVLRDSCWLALALYIAAFDRGVLGLDRMLPTGSAWPQPTNGGRS